MKPLRRTVVVGYHVVSGPSVDNVGSTVARYLRDGWQPVGGLVALRLGYAQTLVLHERQVWVDEHAGDGFKVPAYWKADETNIP